MRTRVYISLALIFSLFLAPIAKADPRLKLQLDSHLNCNSSLLGQAEFELTDNSFALILADFLNNRIQAFSIVMGAKEYISRNLNPLNNIKLSSLDINTFLKDKYPFIQNQQIRWTSEQSEILKEVEVQMLEYNQQMESFLKNHSDVKLFVECLAPTLIKLANLIDQIYEFGEIHRSRLTPRLNESLNGFNLFPSSCSSLESIH